jgi:hypothetical protein
MRRAVPFGSIVTGFSSGGGGALTVVHSSTMVWAKAVDAADTLNKSITSAKNVPKTVDRYQEALSCNFMIFSL